MSVVVLGSHQQIPNSLYSDVFSPADMDSFSITPMLLHPSQGFQSLLSVSLSLFSRNSLVLDREETAKLESPINLSVS